MKTAKKLFLSLLFVSLLSLPACGTVPDPSKEHEQEETQESEKETEHEEEKHEEEKHEEETSSSLSIVSISKINTTGTSDIYSIRYSDNTSSTFSIKHDVSIISIEKVSSASIGDTYVVKYADDTSSTFVVKLLKDETLVHIDATTKYIFFGDINTYIPTEFNKEEEHHEEEHHEEEHHEEEHHEEEHHEEEHHEEEHKEDEDVLPAIDYVKVFAPSNYTHIYAWVGSGGQSTPLLGSWPGSNVLTKYDDNWKTYNFTDKTSFNLIFSESGNNQTADLSVNTAGYYWYYNGSLVNANKDPLKGGSSQDIDLPDPEGFDVVKSAASYSNFPVWNKYDDEHWKTIDKYKGNRDDFRDESIYFMMTSRFYDGDPSNNIECWDGRNNPADDPAWRGDFKGLIEKMDYIKALGFTAIWITPVVENASGYDYHGYHAINFKKVDKRLTSEDVAFQDVIKEAHKRDMKIVLDVVFNHTGNFGEENLFPMFYKDENNQSVSGLVQYDKSLLPNNYASMNGKQQYETRINTMKSPTDKYNIYHHESSMSWESIYEQVGQIAGDCVDLNTENPTVANYLIEAYGEFIRMGVDAFRIDTMKHISRLTFNKYIWPGLYEYARRCGNDHFFMFGEVCTRDRGVWNHGVGSDSCPFYTWKENKDYAWGTTNENYQSTFKHWDDNKNTSDKPTSQNAKLGKNCEYHTPDYSKWSGVSTIDFPMHWNFQYARDAFNVAVNNDQFYNDATYNVVYVDSHDYGPDGIEKVRYNMGTNAWKENMSLMFTFRGVPCIYYGSEVEFQKGKTIDEGPNIALKDSGRAYFGDFLKGSVTASDFGVYQASGTVKDTLNSSLSQHLIKLNKIRLQVPALRRGQYTTDGVTMHGGMAFVRRYTTDKIDSVAAVTISGSAGFNGLPNGIYKDLISGTSITVSNGTLNANVSGQGELAIFVKQ